MRTSAAIKVLVAAAVAVTPLLCQAESTFNTTALPATPITATAHVDFQISVPRFLFLRVGNGTGNYAGGWGTLGTIDEITWSLTTANVGTGPIIGTGGDIVGGGETAVVVANNGNVMFSSQTTGPLNDGVAGDPTISWTTITTNTAHLNTGTTLAAPALADGATTTIPLTAVGKVVQQDAKWTYTYSNATIPAQGTYGGIGVNGGRVLYTASVP